MYVYLIQKMQQRTLIKETAEPQISNEDEKEKVTKINEPSRNMSKVVIYSLGFSTNSKAGD